MLVSLGFDVHLSASRYLIFHAVYYIDFNSDGNIDW